MKDCIPKIKDLFSFEFLYMLFIFAGTFKGGIYLQKLNSIFDLTLALLIISVLLGGFILLKPGKSTIGPISKAYLVFFIIFCCYCLSSYLLSGGGEFAHQKILHFIILGGWVVAAPIVIIRTDKLRINRFIRLTWLYFIVFALSFLITGVSGVEQVGGLGGANYQALGNLAAMAIVICVSLFNFQDRLFAKTALLVLSAILFIPLIYSGSRQSILGLLLCLALVFFLEKLERKIIYISLFVVLVLLGVVFISLSSSSLSDNNALELRMQRYLWAVNSDDQGKSINVRYAFWSKAIETWGENPVFGYGFGRFPETNDLNSHPHNQFLEVVAELGTVGLILLLPLHFIVFFAILRSRIMASWQGKILVLITLFYFASAMFSGDLVTQRNLFGLSAFVCIFADYYLNNKDERDTSGSELSAIPSEDKKPEEEE